MRQKYPNKSVISKYLTELSKKKLEFPKKGLKYSNISGMCEYIFLKYSNISGM